MHLQSDTFGVAFSVSICSFNIIFYKPELSETEKYCSASSLHNKKQPATVKSISIHQPPHLLLAWTLAKMIHSRLTFILVK